MIRRSSRIVSRGVRRWRVGAVVFLALSLAVPPAPAFEGDFHYYVIYILLRARGYAPAQAHELAGFSQYVDDNFKTEPLFSYSENRARYHFAGSGKNRQTTRNEPSAGEAVKRSFESYLAGEPQGKYLTGAALHLLADTFSHHSFTAWWNEIINRREYWFPFAIGHSDAAELGHKPDRPYNDPEVAVAAAKAIYEQIPPAANAPMVAWSALEADLAAALGPPASGPNKKPALENRIGKLRQLIQCRFHEDTVYFETEFKKERGAFNAAVAP